MVRGALGGVVVHEPDERMTARTAALVLQARNVLAGRRLRRPQPARADGGRDASPARRRRRSAAKELRRADRRAGGRASTTPRPSAPANARVPRAARRAGRQPDADDRGRDAQRDRVPGRHRGLPGRAGRRVAADPAAGHPLAAAPGRAHRRRRRRRRPRSTGGRTWPSSARCCSASGPTHRHRPARPLLSRPERRPRVAFGKAAHSIRTLRPPTVRAQVRLGCRTIAGRPARCPTWQTSKRRADADAATSSADASPPIDAATIGRLAPAGGRPVAAHGHQEVDRPGREPDPRRRDPARALERRRLHRAGGGRRGRPVAPHALPVLREQGRPAPRRVRGGDAHLRPDDPRRRSPTSTDPLERLGGGDDRRRRGCPSAAASGVDVGLARLRLKLGEVEPELVARSQEPVTSLFLELHRDAVAAGALPTCEPATGRRTCVAALNSAFITARRSATSTASSCPSRRASAAFCLRGLGAAEWHRRLVAGSAQRSGCPTAPAEAAPLGDAGSDATEFACKYLDLLLAYASSG